MVGVGRAHRIQWVYKKICYSRRDICTNRWLFYNVGWVILDFNGNQQVSCAYNQHNVQKSVLATTTS